MPAGIAAEKNSEVTSTGSIRCHVLRGALFAGLVACAIQAAIRVEPVRPFPSFVDDAHDNDERGFAQRDGAPARGVRSTFLETSENVLPCSTCSFADADRGARSLNPLLRALTATPFFSTFEVDLGCGCPFWDDEGFCMNDSCEVKQCEAHEIPHWGIDEVSERRAESQSGCDASDEIQENIDRSLESEQRSAIEAWATIGEGSWPTGAGFSTHSDPSQFVYVNLLKNPERFTGYSGASAHKVWDAIYTENCFTDLDGDPFGQCQEEIIFYRLISGMHTSITVHLCAKYPQRGELSTAHAWGFGGIDSLLKPSDTQDGCAYGPNLELFSERLGNKRDFVDNLYVSFLVVSRAVQKAAPALRNLSYFAGGETHSTETRDLVERILSDDGPLSHAFSGRSFGCGALFDENCMFQGPNGDRLLSEFQNHFRNVTSIISCTTCERCRLWGKLQTLGLATALKILFPSVGELPRLQRREVIALFNTLERFSQSIEEMHNMHNMLSHPST